MIQDSQNVGFAFPTQNNDPESMKALMRVMQQHFVSKIASMKIFEDGPRTHCLVFSIVLHLAEVKLIGHLQIFLILYYVGPLRHQEW